MRAECKELKLEALQSCITLPHKLVVFCVGWHKDKLIFTFTTSAFYTTGNYIISHSQHQVTFSQE